MEFDHLENKAHSVSAMVDMKASRARIIAEVAKTELVCILCHRFRTFSRRMASGVRVGRNRKTWSLVTRFKARPCEVCGERRPWYQMDLDHRDPTTKVFALAYARDFTEAQVKEELGKCALLCALCHRRKTFKGVYLDLLASPEGVARPNIKITSGVVDRILGMKRQGALQKDIALAMGLSQGVVSNIVRSKYKNTRLAPEKTSIGQA